MKTNKFVEGLKAKSAAELQEELVAAKKELFNLRISLEFRLLLQRNLNWLKV